MEKDLLDVALRLGTLIEQKLPSAEVVYTRKDDTFVPLEERTAIANERRRIYLFPFTPRTSSQDESARGIETYYLNFATTNWFRNRCTTFRTSSKKSLEMKNSENQKELASDIQDSLTQRLQLVSHSEDQMKKAPFVVLIGADMPSVLSEFHFVSNPNNKSCAQNGPARKDRRRLFHRNMFLPGQPEQPLEQPAEIGLR